MLQIGFSTKYFTLWNVINETQYSGDRGQYAYNVTKFQYIQNLSLNEEKAKEKAKGFGVKDLSVNDDLYGKSGKSWEKRERIVKTYEPFQFRFGKYEDEDIRKSDDVDYLKWYFGETDNMIAAERMVELDDSWSIVDGELLTATQVEGVELKKSIEVGLKKTGKIVVFVDRNIDDHGSFYVDGVSYIFDDIVERWYRDYPYYLPVLGGKSKRIKNKTVELTVEFGQRFDYDYWIVKDFKIVK
jgi:hypothetical protein